MDEEKTCEVCGIVLDENNTSTVNPSRCVDHGEEETSESAGEEKGGGEETGGEEETGSEEAGGDEEETQE